MIAGTLYCCECNLCSLYSCPEDLDPKNVCVLRRSRWRGRRSCSWTGRPGGRPAASARRRAARADAAADGEARAAGLPERRPARGRGRSQPRRVVLPLKQHAGAPAHAAVRRGRARRRRATSSRRRPAGALGARLHASIAGTVRDVDGRGRHRSVRRAKGRARMATLNSIGLVEVSIDRDRLPGAGRDAQGGRRPAAPRADDLLGQVPRRRRRRRGGGAGGGRRRRGACTTARSSRSASSPTSTPTCSRPSACRSTSRPRRGAALGVIETFSASSIVDVADAAAKSADVVAASRPPRDGDRRQGLRAADRRRGERRGGGRGRRRRSAADEGILVGRAVIARPRRELFREYV